VRVVWIQSGGGGIPILGRDPHILSEQGPA